MTLRALAVLAIVFIPALGTADDIPPLRENPRNLSSHPPEFFRDLLAGRVWVHRQHGLPAAILFAKDGTLKGCWSNRARTRYVRSNSTMKWKIGTPAGASNLDVSWTKSGTERHYRTVIIYNPVTGAFHGERFFSKTKTWKIGYSGWLQNSWPAALQEACPTLVLPVDLPVDEYQNSTDWAEIVRNASPVKRHPGSAHSYPGATGLAATNSQRTMTPAQVAQLRKRAHGFISHHTAGHTLVAVNNPGAREIWMLDPDNDIVDTASVTSAINDTINIVHWKSFGIRSSHRVGFPVPVLLTSKRHPAFQMMDDLADNNRTVVLPDTGNPPVSCTFSRDAEIHSPSSNGTWFISRGKIHLEISGFARSYPWRKFASVARWTP